MVMFIGGCAGLHAPWHRRPPPPETSTELDITPAGVPQVWRRNDVVVDLSGVSGTGTAVLQPAAGRAWPVRLILRVRPGSIGELEVRGDQRWVAPVTAAGTAAVDLELPVGVYSAGTPRLTVNWGPATAAQ